MILENNLKILNNKFNINYSINMENNIYIEEETKNKENTIYFLDDNNRRQYLHSKYDPSREAQNIVSSFQDIENKKGLIFFGLGLGYHFEEILSKNEDARVYIIEPKKEIFDLFLKTVSLSSYIDRIYGIDINNYNIGNDLSRFLDINNGDVEIIDLPSYKKNFNKEHTDFSTEFIELIKNKTNNIFSTRAFQDRWIINSINNFSMILNTPNIIKEKKGYYNGETAILVSAGPSLDYEIDNLREIKEKGNAYIFSVGSAINTLIKYNIYPDATFSYDPKPTNKGVIKKIKTENIKSIPLIFGSSVGYETLYDFPGKMYNFFTNQDTVSNYYLDYEIDKNGIDVIKDASSIAVITMQVLSILGFSKIIFVGQNLSYVGNRNHSTGVSYSKKVTEEQLNNAILVSDVDGNKVYTNEGYMIMKSQLEHYIEKFSSNVKFYNTTKNGVNIEGAEYITLSDCIADIGNQIRIKSLDDIDFSNYNIKALDKRRKKMFIEYKKIKKINQEYNRVLSQISKSIKVKNYRKLETLYINLDNQLKKIENNDFYKVFIIPMIRLEYKLLVDNIDNFNDIVNPEEKGNEIYSQFKSFIDTCIENFNKIEKMYLDMDLEIQEYINDGR